MLNYIPVVPEVVHQYFLAKSFGVKRLVDVGNGEVQEDANDLFGNAMG